MKATYLCLIYLLVTSFMPAAPAYHEELIIRNSWKDNPLGLTMRRLNSIDGTATYMPGMFIVHGRLIYIGDGLESKDWKIVVFDQESKTTTSHSIGQELIWFTALERDKLLCLRRSQLFEFDIKLDQATDLVQVGDVLQIFYDQNRTLFWFPALGGELVIGDLNTRKQTLEIAKIYEQAGYKYFDYMNYIKNTKMYSPSEDRTVKYDNKLWESYSSGMVVYDFRSRQFGAIKAKGGDFGFRIIGVDQEGNIYTANSQGPDKILIHDNFGKKLLEIAPSIQKYGSDPDTALYDGLENYFYVPYVTGAGDIYLMMRLKEALAIVRYYWEQ